MLLDDALHQRQSNAGAGGGLVVAGLAVRGHPTEELEDAPVVGRRDTGGAVYGAGNATLTTAYNLALGGYAVYGAVDSFRNEQFVAGAAAVVGAALALYGAYGASDTQATGDIPRRLQLAENAAGATANDAGPQYTLEEVLVTPDEQALEPGIDLVGIFAFGLGVTHVAARGAVAFAKGAGVADVLMGAARRAVGQVGPGRGSAYGTRVHSAFEAEVKALGDESLNAEVSYLRTKVVARGTPGSIRVDVVNGPQEAPTAIFDLKTGSATLTTSRVQQIQSHIPGGKSVPVFQIKP